MTDSATKEIFIYPEGVDSVDGIQRVAGNKKLYDKLLFRLANTLPQNIIDIEVAIEQNEFEKISAYAHSIKGAAANLSASTIQEKSLYLEEVAKASSSEEVAQAFSELKIVVNSYLAALAMV